MTQTGCVLFAVPHNMMITTYREGCQCGPVQRLGWVRLGWYR
jgi:hypothetical protein